MKSILRKHFNKSVLHIAFFVMCFTALWLGSNMTAFAATTLTKIAVKDLDDDTRGIECGKYVIFLGYDPATETWNESTGAGIPKLYILGNGGLASAQGEFDVTDTLKGYIKLNNGNYEITKIVIDTTGKTMTTLSCNGSNNPVGYYNGKNHRFKDGALSGTTVLCTYHNRYFAKTGTINITVKRENNLDIASTIIETSSDK